MSFEALSQIEKHEAAELLYLKKAKEQRKAANSLRKQYKIKMEADVISIEEPAVPEVVVAQPVAAESPLQVQSEFKELPMQAPGAPVKKARKPMTAEHLAKLQAGRKASLERKAAAKLQEQQVQQEQPVNRVLEFVAEPIAAPVPQNEMVVGEAPAAAKKPRSPKGKQDPLILAKRKAINNGVKITCERFRAINKHLQLKGANEDWGATKASELSRIAAKYGEDVMSFIGDEAALLALLKSKDASITFPPQ
jgi:hypothetical protein